MKYLIYLSFLMLIGGLIFVPAVPVYSEMQNNSSGQYQENQSLKLSNLTDDPVAKMVAFVKEAAAYAKANGKEAACKEFSNRNGSFFRGSLYIYGYDFDGITLAHPLQTELIGNSRLLEKDSAGDLFITNLRNAARNGTGFVVFHYINPAHNNTQGKKLGYVEKIDDTWWIGSGIYGENVTIPDEATGNLN